MADVRSGDAEAIKADLASGRDPNCSLYIDGVEYSPLSLAAGSDSAIVSILLNGGADPERSGTLGAPLCLAVAEGRPRSASLLLEHHANPNVQCWDGAHKLPVLMMAARTRNANLIRSLLRAGADPTARDDTGRSVSDVATSDSAILEILSSGGDGILPLGPQLSPMRRRPIPVGGTVPPPQKLLDVAPTYPPIARSARVQGDVIVEIVINEGGSVEDARVVRSVPLLDAAALAAVRQWQFARTTVNGVRIPIVMRVEVPFRLAPAK